VLAEVREVVLQQSLSPLVLAKEVREVEEQEKVVGVE